MQLFMKKLLKCSTAILLTLSLAGCHSAKSSDPVSNDLTADAFVERFNDPEMNDKPITRWWVPGAKMDKKEIEAEIQSMVDAGLGGAEIVPVSLAGGDGEGKIDWGSQEWKETTKYILETASKYNFTIDFTMTPAWPLALPTIEDVNDPSQGAQMELDGAWIDGITKSNPFHGKIPISKEAIDDVKNVDGKVKLVGVTVAKYTDKENKILSYESAKALDIAKLNKKKDGSYELSYTPEDDGEYVLYAWYQHPSGNQKYENNQIDHYSKEGTQMIIDYWEKELIPYYDNAWQSCRSLFIDSLEFETHLDWTYDLADAFKNTYNYDVIAYLPGIYDASNEMTSIGNYMGDPVSTFTFDKNTNQVQNDYKENLTQLYIENHIKPLEEFCKKNGVTLRYQTSYGKNLEVAQTAMYPDIPETESLYGNDYMDFYRLQAGAVHTTDKNIYSMETAAEWTETWNDKKDNGEYGTRGNGESNSGNYEQTFQDHLWHDQRAYASGANQVILHGYPYSGLYKGKALEGTQWPGFTGFESYKWSNSWGERQPNWKYASTYLDYLSRSQLTLRQGTPRIDVAVYHHSYYETIDFWGPDKILQTDSLEQNGYSYDFISPSTLNLDNMTVENGILDHEGAGYRALIFDNESDISYKTAKKILEYAKNGLTIIFVGTTPNDESYTNDKDISSIMKKILKQKTVIQIENIEEIVSTLKDANIIPDASYNNQTLLTTHRNSHIADYYYIYNYGGTDNYQEIADAENVKTDIVFKGEGTPYLADAWTGEITKINDYTTDDGHVTVHVDIAANDSCIIILSDEKFVSKDIDQTEKISNDIKIENWNLSVESWTKGKTVLDTKKTNINVGELSQLTSWDHIDGLENVSGIGSYTATFETAADYEKGQKAYLHTGKIKDAFGVTINNKEIVVDQVSGIADISKYLKKGKNEIKITVATSLLNAILEENKNILNEDGRVLDDRHPSSYGLTEDVMIKSTK